METINVSESNKRRIAVVTKKSLSQRLVDRRIVEFTRALVQDLTRDEISELLNDWNTDRKDPRSLGSRFIVAMEGLYGEGIVLQRESDDVFDLDASASHTIKVIAGQSEAVNGVVEVGGRRRKTIYYVFTLTELSMPKLAPRDPLSLADTEVEEGYARNFEVELYDESGNPVIDLDTQACVALAWETREFPNQVLQANVANVLKPGAVVEQLKGWIPSAVSFYRTEKRRLLDSWEDRRRELLTVKPKATVAYRTPEPELPVYAPPSAPELALPPQLRQQIVMALMRGSPTRYDQISALFVDSRISPWRGAVPQMSSSQEEIDRLVDMLFNRSNDQGVSALVLYLEVLKDRTSPGDGNYAIFTRLAAELRVLTEAPARDTALELAERSLAILERQAAGYTDLTRPAHLQIELEGQRRKVAQLRGY